MACAFWNFNIEQLQVLYFSQKTHEHWVEIHSYKTLSGKFGFFLYEQELV
jgi:hypothetical protein